MRCAALASVLICGAVLSGCTEVVQFAQGPRTAITDAHSYANATAGKSTGRTTLAPSQAPGSEKAMQACVEAAGIVNSYEMLPPAAAGASYSVLAGQNVSQSQAGAINSCIAKGAPVKRVDAVYQDREDYAPELSSGYSGDFSYDCGGSVFVGGSGYCIKGN